MYVLCTYNSSNSIAEPPSKRARIDMNAILVSHMDELKQINREIAESIHVMSEASVELNNILKTMSDRVLQLIELSSSQKSREN